MLLFYPQCYYGFDWLAFDGFLLKPVAKIGIIPEYSNLFVLISCSPCRPNPFGGRDGTRSVRGPSPFLPRTEPAPSVTPVRSASGGGAAGAVR